MTDRATSIVALIATCALAGVTLLMFIGWTRADTRADRAESTLEHVVRSCRQDAEGAAVCPPRTFTPLTTTTTTSAP